MNIFSLGAAMLADAICTIVTGGLYLATRNGYDSTSEDLTLPLHTPK